MSQPELPPFLKSGERARLIPVGSEKSQERRATSVFLASLTVVDEFARAMLDSVGQKVGKRYRITCFTEVVLAQNGDKKDRPDGLIILTTGKRRWSALVEAKTGNALLANEQIERYVAIAKANNIDAVITVSNQFAALPTHHPVKLSRSALKGVDLFHWSWVYIRTQAVLDMRIHPDIDPEQRYILGEMVRFLKHESSGVKTFDRMNKEWKGVCQKVRTGVPMSKTSEEVRSTVGAWHQEQRDICLLLTRKLKTPVSLQMTRKEKNDPEHRLSVDGQSLAQNHVLTATLVVPDAAAPIDIVVDLARRTLSCSMRIAAPSDKKSTKARVNWLLRQLPKEDTEGIQITAEWSGRAMDTSALVSALREDPNIIVGDNASRVPNWLKVSLVRDMAGKFSGAKTFVETTEAVISDFYQQVGERLKAWVPAPPKLQKKAASESDREVGSTSSPVVSEVVVNTVPDNPPEQASSLSQSESLGTPPVTSRSQGEPEHVDLSSGLSNESDTDSD